MKFGFIWMLLYASLLSYVTGLIDQSALDKDLYAILGLSKSASLKDIKAEFKKLAKIHHPDKSKASNKDANAEIFRQIAQAYEILSDSTLKSEYDAQRTKNDNKSSSTSSQSYDSYTNYDYTFNNQRQNMNSNPSNHDFFSRSNGIFNDILNGGFYSSPPPRLAVRYFPTTEEVFPYSMIVLSENRLYFSYLDYDCSLGVYQGDASLILNSIMAGIYPDIYQLGITTLFRTPAAPQLRGQCFMALNRNGYLRIYASTSSSYGFFSSSYHHIWQSEKHHDHDHDVDHDYHFYHNYDRYYVELLDDGEFSVQRLRRGHRDADCIWSTMSCNRNFAILYKIHHIARDSLLNLRLYFDELVSMEWYKDRISSIIRSIKSVINDVHVTVKRSKFYRRIGSFINNVKRTLHIWKSKTSGNTRSKGRPNR